MRVSLHDNMYRISFTIPLFFKKLFDLSPFQVIDYRNKNKRHKSKPTTQYDKFKRDVLEIHNYKCAKCGVHQSKKRLTIHHFKSWVQEPEFRFDVDSAAPLCRDHHHEFHEIYGYEDFSASDFFNYLGSKTNNN